MSRPIRSDACASAGDACVVVAPRRRAVMVGAAGAALLAASGCISIGGGDTASPVWYLLEDPGARPDGATGSPASASSAPVGSASPAAPERILLVGPVSAPRFYDSSMVAFSRAPGALALYQFAGWAERPGRRIGTLVEQRLAARRRFAAVAQSTAGVRGDLLLNLSIEQLVHDASVSPGAARVALGAELLDWRARRLIARHSFERSAPVEREAADAAVRAMAQALGAVLDALCPWVEEAAARA